MEPRKRPRLLAVLYVLQLPDDHHQAHREPPVPSTDVQHRDGGPDRGYNGGRGAFAQQKKQADDHPLHALLLLRNAPQDGTEADTKAEARRRGKEGRYPKTQGDNRRQNPYLFPQILAENGPVLH